MYLFYFTEEYPFRNSSFHLPFLLLFLEDFNFSFIQATSNIPKNTNIKTRAFKFQVSDKL